MDVEEEIEDGERPLDAGRLQRVVPVLSMEGKSQKDQLMEKF